MSENIQFCIQENSTLFSMMQETSILFQFIILIINLFSFNILSLCQTWSIATSFT